MQNWIVQIDLLAFKLRTELFEMEQTELFEMEQFLYAKRNCLKYNCFWHWNRIYDKLNCLK